MRIVVGYAETAEGRSALETAVEEARRRRAELVVVHSAKGGSHEDDEHIWHDEDALEQLRGRLEREAIDVGVRMLIRGNTPSRDVVEVAAEVGADLIVIGLRHRSPVGKLILGSTAQEILLDAPCPVLAVKAGQRLSAFEEETSHG